MDDNDYQLSKFQFFTLVISNKYSVLKFCPLVLDAAVYIINSFLSLSLYIYIYITFVVGPKRERNILKWVGPRRDFYFFKDLIMYLILIINGLMCRVFTNGSEDRGSIPGQVIPKTQKSVLYAALLNPQLYKVRIKGKVE